jgi:chromosome segregation ATPase
MTVVGKLFTLLIFLMSVLFLTFSIMVYITHVDWRQIAVEQLKPELDTVDSEIRSLRTERAELQQRIRHEQAALRSALIALELRAIQTQELLRKKEDNNNKLAADRLERIQELTVIQDDIKALVGDKEKGIPGEIAEVEAQIDDHKLKSDAEFERAVELTGQIHEAVGMHRRLTERYLQLQEQIDRIQADLPSTTGTSP